MTRPFAWGTDGTSSSRAEIEADAKIVVELASPGSVPASELRRQIPLEWLDANLQRLQPKIQPGERIRSQTFWLLEVPSIELSYGLPGKRPIDISFEGRRMLAPPLSIDTQFFERASKLKVLRYALIGFGVAIPITYFARGSYFRSGWVAGLSLCIAAGLFAIDGFVRERSLGRKKLQSWALAVAVAAILACVFAIGAEPSARAAHKLEQAGRFEEARVELEALGPESANATAWSDFYLAKCLHSESPEDATSSAARIPPNLPQRAIANKHVYDLLSKGVRRHLSDGDVATAERVVAATSLAFEGSTQLGPEVAALRAQVFDAEYAECRSDACRWAAAVHADDAERTDTRLQRKIFVRTKILDALSQRPDLKHVDVTVLDQLDELQQLSSANKATGGDELVARRAEETLQWVHDARQSIPLLGSARGIAARLLGSTADDGRLLAASDPNVVGYCSIRGDRCTGLYITGNDKADRVLNNARRAAPASRLLSQAIGRTILLPDPPTHPHGLSSVTRSKVGSYTIAARWRGADLIELRIGDAEP